MQRYLGKKNFPFIKLSSRIISDYQGKLLASGICDNTIGFYLHNIKALFRKGCREMGLELPCPFRDISIKTEKTLKRSLDPVVILKHYPQLNWKRTARYLLPGTFSCSAFTRVECHSSILHC